MKVTSLPFSILLLVVWLITDICAEKILDVSKGSTAVLRPDLVEAEVTSITWKYGDGLAADWYGRGVPFYRSFKDGCSLGTKTGELIIHDVKLKDGGVYTPEINSKTLTAITLRVYSPVPKPHITLNYSPENTKCSLTCSFDRTDEMGDVEVFWIVGDTIEKGGGELHISEETKEKTFICRLNNTVSSENSNELQNPFWTDDSPRRILNNKLIVTLLAVALFAALIICLIIYLLLRKEDAANPAEDVRKSLLYDLKTREPTGYPELASSSKNKPGPATRIDLEAEDPNRD